MKRAGARILAAAVIAVFAALISCQGCVKRKGKNATPPATSAPPAAAAARPAPPPPPPAPGEREFTSATAAMGRGDVETASAGFEAVLGLGSRAPARAEALFMLGLLKARPDDPSRDVTRAKALFLEAARANPQSARAAEIRIILGLLAFEEERELSLQALRDQIESSKGETETLKRDLAAREDELRRIKEILLEKTPGG